MHMVFRIYHLAQKLIGGNYCTTHRYPNGIEARIKRNDVVDDDDDDFYERSARPPIKQRKAQSSFMQSSASIGMAAMEEKNKMKEVVWCSWCVMPQIEWTLSRSFFVQRFFPSSLRKKHQKNCQMLLQTTQNKYLRRWKEKADAVRRSLCRCVRFFWPERRKLLAILACGKNGWLCTWSWPAFAGGLCCSLCSACARFVISFAKQLREIHKFSIYGSNCGHFVWFLLHLFGTLRMHSRYSWNRDE